MRMKGRVKDWRDDKGFGFVEPSLPGPEVFVHVNSFQRRGRRPQVGDLLTYELGQDSRGRPRAEQVAFSLDAIRVTRVETRAKGRIWPVPLALLVLVGLSATWIAGRLPSEVFGLYLLSSPVAFLMYGWDKVAATGGRWRTQESTLLLVGLMGGWPGALIAQEKIRHKTAKASFQATFWFTVLINVSVLGWLFSTDFALLDKILQRSLDI